jgi:hypothetical protein
LPASNVHESVGVGDPEVEELVRYFERPARFWKVVLAVPVLGLLALVTDPDKQGLDRVWVIAAALVWISAVLIVTSVVAPSLNRMRSTLLAPEGPLGGFPVEGAERVRLARFGALASRGAALCDLLFFAALALMIWRP